MDLTWSDDEEAFRAEARAWLEQNLAEWHDEVGGHPESGDTSEGFAQHLLWERRLFADRWAVVSWAPEHGGRGASLWEWLLFEEEYYRAGGPQRITQNGIFLLAPSIYEFGTAEQRDGILPRMAGGRGPVVPGLVRAQRRQRPRLGRPAGPAGSTGGWVLDGQKTWTTRGAFCTHLFGLFRTDPESERHKGLTYLLVPLDTPGVTVRGFGRLDGDEGFAEVFFEDAFLADDAVAGGVVLGEPEGGWGVAMATAGSERGLTLRSPGRFLATADRLIDEHRASGASDPVLRRRIADAWMNAEAYQLQTLQTVTKLASGAQGRRRGQPHQAVVVRARRRAARGRPRPARPRRRARGPVEQGLAVLAVGPDLRRHQRDPAQHRRRAPPRPAEEVATPMRFACTDDQLAFRDAARDLLAKECTAGRGARRVGRPRRRARPRRVALARRHGRAVDPRARGRRRPRPRRVRPRAACSRSPGVAALPHPIVETAMVAAPLGVDVSSRLVTSDPRRPRRLPARRRRGARGRRRPAASCVDDFEVERVDTVDGGRRTGDLRADRRRRARSWPTSPTPWRCAFDRGVLGTAAQLVGLSRAMLELTVDYVKERQQFGVPVGSFQAVKHHLAERPPRHRVRRARRRPGGGDDRRRRADPQPRRVDGQGARHRRRRGHRAGRPPVPRRHRLHGRARPAPLLKRSWALARAWGDRGFHADRVAAALQL